jgi:two-component system sensor histidine kinase AlgZ
MKQTIRKFKNLFFGVGTVVPHIPNFSDVWNIFKVIMVSLLICTLYSFSKVDKASEVYFSLQYNIREFIPYLISMIILLVTFSKVLKKISPIFAVFLIIILNIFSIYFVFSITYKNYLLFFTDWDRIVNKLAVSFGILFFFLIYFDWREKNLDPANTIARLIFLQSKMRPHFLFNTLNSAISLIKKEPESAKKIIFNLSELLRVSLREDSPGTLYTLKEEVNLCKKYLEIEKIRLRDRLQVNWNQDDNTDFALVPRLFLQPLIENSVLHGIQQLENDGIIEISIKKTLQDRLFIEIKNPIPKQNTSKDHKGNNISLKNTEERLSIYYNGDVILKNEKINNIYYVGIEIPILLEGK